MILKLLVKSIQNLFLIAQHFPFYYRRPWYLFPGHNPFTLFCQALFSCTQDSWCFFTKNQFFITVLFAVNDLQSGISEILYINRAGFPMWHCKPSAITLLSAMKLKCLPKGAEKRRAIIRAEVSDYVSFTSYKKWSAHWQLDIII